MDDLISRQAAIDFIDAGRLVNPNEPRWSDNEVVAFLKSRPSAERRGRWETEITTNRDGTKSARYACSVCGVMALDEWHYCPNCGARMEASE